MSSDGSSSIFDQAGKTSSGKDIFKKKKSPFSGKRDPAPIPEEVPSAPVGETGVVAPADRWTDDELQAHFQNAVAMHNSLNEEAAKLYEKVGINRTDADNILASTHTFSTKARNFIEQKKIELQNTLWKGLSEDQKKRIKIAEERRRSAKRKTKSLGARKGWISMG